MRLLAFTVIAAITTFFGSLAFGQKAPSLTGNWAVKVNRQDGTWAKQYFNLKEDGGKITGTVRSTQFFYAITESTGDANGFTFTASMKDGK